MRLTYDSQADAMYIEFSNADVSSTKLIAADGNINADLDDEGKVVGIEIVGVRYCLQYIEQQSGLDIPLKLDVTATSPAR